MSFVARRRDAAKVTVPAVKSTIRRLECKNLSADVLVDVGLSICSSSTQSCCILQINPADYVWQFQDDGEAECVSKSQRSTAPLIFDLETSTSAESFKI